MNHFAINKSSHSFWHSCIMTTVKSNECEENIMCILLPLWWWSTVCSYVCSYLGTRVRVRVTFLFFFYKPENLFLSVWWCLLVEANIWSNDLPLHIFPAENSPLPDLCYTSTKLSLASLLSPKINCLRCEWVKTTQRCHYFTAIDHAFGNTSQ